MWSIGAAIVMVGAVVAILKVFNPYRCHESPNIMIQWDADMTARIIATLQIGSGGGGYRTSNK